MEHSKAILFFLEILSRNNKTEIKVEHSMTPMLATGNTVEEGRSFKLSSKKYIEK